MRRNRQNFSSDSDLEDEEDDDDTTEDEDDEEDDPVARRRRRKGADMKCLSCKEDYGHRDAGTCRECYEEAGETEEELKREIDDLKSKVNFLRLVSFDSGLIGSSAGARAYSAGFSDVVLVASDSQCDSPSIPAHRAVLV